MTQEDKSKVQGEGDYEAARRYRKRVETFTHGGQVDEAAKNAEPRDDLERADLEAAEQEGLRHSKAKGQ